MADTGVDESHRVRVKRVAGKTRRWGLLIFLIMGVLAMPGGTACRQAGSPGGDAETEPGPESVAVVRTLPATVNPGQQFEVTVTFTSPHDQFHAIGLTEVAPEGWSVTVNQTWATPVALAAHTPEPEQAAYIWAGPYSAGVAFTVVYRVKVPARAAAGNYTFAGILEYYIQPYPAPSHSVQVGGDARVTVR